MFSMRRAESTTLPVLMFLVTAHRSVLAGHLLGLSEGMKHILTRFGARRPAPTETEPPAGETSAAVS